MSRTPPDMKLPRSLLVATALTLGACSSPTQMGLPAASQDRSTIEVVNIAYSPEELEVAEGDTVTWTNGDSGVRHTVTSGSPAGDSIPGVSEGEPARPDGLFDGDLTDEGASFTFTFEEAGDYDYFCVVHPSMTARIIVR